MAGTTTHRNGGLLRDDSWLPLIFILCLVLIVLQPSWNLGFVSDDFVHLVEDGNLSPLQSSDGLHRPLRNIFFRLSSRFVGLDPLPYHLLMVFLFLCAVALLYHITIQLNHGWLAALAAATAFGFFPRHHQVLFWFASMQDLVVGVCSLLVFSFFFRYRRAGRTHNYLIALFAFCVALGFKETSVAILPMLVMVDLYRDLGLKELKRRIVWRAYVPFVLCLALFFLLGAITSAASPIQKWYSFYGIVGGMKNILSYAVNILHPLSPALGLSEFKQPTYGGVFVLEAGLILAVALVFAKRKDVLIGLAWALTFMLPTAFFAPYADRYVFVPLMGLAFLSGSIAEGLVARARTRRMNIALAAGVALVLGTYTVLAIDRLRFYERCWSRAANEVRTIVSETLRLYPDVSSPAILYYLNLPHSEENGQVFVINNGLRGALWAAGYDRSVATVGSFASTESRYQQLVEQVLSCKDQALMPAAASKEHVLVYRNGHLIDCGGSCAESVVKESIATRGSIWQEAQF